jgi:hypothetical protein
MVSGPFRLEYRLRRAQSSCDGKVVVTRQEGRKEGVKYNTDGRCKLGVCRGQRQRKGRGNCESVVEHGCLCRDVTNRTATATHSHA